MVAGRTFKITDKCSPIDYLVNYLQIGYTVDNHFIHQITTDCHKTASNGSK